jgi:methylmalonyl-CoA/ethylmalonyl-CoA epimerase
MSGLKWMYHATAMGPSYDAIFEPLERLFGARVLHDNELTAPGLERRGGMVWLADGSIEIGEPIGPSSELRRFIERFGGGMHSIAVQVEDLDESLDRAAARGVRVAARVRPDLAFTRPADTAGILIEWRSGWAADDPRWGARLPPAVGSPAVTPLRLAFAGVVAPDPVATAARLAEVIGTNWSALPACGLGSPEAVVDLRDCLIACYRMPPPPESTLLWGLSIDRPRCHAIGLQVDDPSGATAALEATGVRVLHRNPDGSRVLGGGGLAFPIVLVDELLIGDPRCS